LLFAIGICLATIAVVLLVHAGSRFIMRPEAEGETKDLAGSTLFRIAGLHGLVLALVFASEVVEYQQIEREVASEVNAVSDIYYDLSRYGLEDPSAIREHLRAYLAIASSDEWAQLGREYTLNGSAWASWEAVYHALLDLEPTTARQVALRDNMLGNIDLIAENRDLREHHAKTNLSDLFWVAALLGVVLVSAGFFIYPSTRNNVILLGIFGGYTGFILFTIFSMSNPFSAPGALEPIQFRELLIEFESAS
jgi:hypothetical protein